MDKESSSRKRKESGSHREREASEEHHHHHRHKSDEDRRRSDDNDRRRSESRSEREGVSRRDSDRSDSGARNKRKDRWDSEERNDKKARVYESNGREKRKFEDTRVSDGGYLGEGLGSRGTSAKIDSTNGLLGPGTPIDAGSARHGVETGSVVTTTDITHDTLTGSQSPATKVSSISKTHENKGVNINRPHEVPGKSSTDGTASNSGKSGGLSLDALAKAKKALQMQKELAERMKKIPVLNKESAKEPRSRAPEKGAPLASASFPTGLTSSNGASASPSSMAAQVIASPIGLPPLPGLTAQKYEAVKRAQELAAKMGFRQDPEFGPLINLFPGQVPPDVSIHPKPSRAPVLRLDALGREIDEHGNVVNVSKVNSLSTLKVNINKQKKDGFQILKPELDVDPEKNPYFDPRMGIDKTKLLRPKRASFQFVEEGKWSKEAEIIKLKAQFGEAKAKELKAKQAQLARARSDSDINPNLIEIGERIMTKEKPKESIPHVEWWDVPVLTLGIYGDIIDGGIVEDKIKMEKITIYVEHPRPIDPPAEPAPPPPQPLKLTKKEQKKLRTHRRLTREKERQEMIRLGVMEPPKPKVKMSNLMRVLGAEASQDPTKLEMQIRSEAAEREQAHIDRNIARKLTPGERREKKERQLFDDPGNLETIVSVYKVNDLSHPQARFKVDVNAQENKLSGCALISEGLTVIVVEGGAKSIKRYGKLMLRRIDWASAVTKDEDGDGSGAEDDKPTNTCVLVWQGSVARPNFGRFSIQECRTETAARKYFQEHGVAHYWDLAINFTEEEAF